MHARSVTEKLGHAGAIITGGKGTSESKIKAFQDSRVNVADVPYQIVDLVNEVLRKTAGV